MADTRSSDQVAQGLKQAIRGDQGKQDGAVHHEEPAAWDWAVCRHKAHHVIAGVEAMANRDDDDDDLGAAQTHLAYLSQERPLPVQHPTLPTWTWLPNLHFEC